MRADEFAKAVCRREIESSYQAMVSTYDLEPYTLAVWHRTLICRTARLEPGHAAHFAVRRWMAQFSLPPLHSV